MNVLAITQARSGSTRLPGKVLKIIEGKSLLSIHLERVLKSRRINQVLVASTIEKADDAIEAEVKKMNLPVYRGSVQNVLDRYYQAAKPYQPNWVVRLTSDCPLIDATLIDKVIETAIEKNVDYCSNTLHSTFPDGVDVEVFKFTVLEKAWKEAALNSDKEHVTPYIYRNSDFNKGIMFSSANIDNDVDYSHVRLTVDEESDFNVIMSLVKHLGTDKDWKTYADFYLSHNDTKKLNEHINRNEGYKKSLNND